MKTPTGRRSTRASGLWGRFVGRTAVRGEIRVPDSQTAVDLFTMTPYYWKTGPQAAQRLETVEGFSTEIGFDFLLYQRQ